MLKFGELDLIDLRLGEKQVVRAYMGNELVWGTAPEPAPVPIVYFSLTVSCAQEDASVTLTYGSTTITETGSASITVLCGTEVTYTITDGTNTVTNTVAVTMDSTILIDLTVAAYTYNVLAISDQSTYERPPLAYVRATYDNFNATYKLLSTGGCPVKIPVGTTARITVFASDMRWSSQATAKSSSNITFGARQAKLLTVTRVPSNAMLLVTDYYGYPIPVQSDSGGVATYYQPQYTSGMNTVKVTASKEGYETKTVSYNPTYNTAKSLSITLQSEE